MIDRTPGCRVIDIAEALSITIGGTSKLVDRIENAGWCERSPNPDDGRSSTIALTRSGRRLLAAARRSFADELAARIGTALPANDLQALRERRSANCDPTSTTTETEPDHADDPDHHASRRARRTRTTRRTPRPRDPRSDTAGR